MTVRFGWFAFAVSCVTAAAPAFGAPRDVVDQIATIIDNNYFDVAKAREIAKDLRAAAQAGRFDARVDSRDLAAALTAQLRPLDHHFNVLWSPLQPAASGANAAAALPHMSAEAQDRRSAYGFRRVEMLPGAIGLIDMRSFADFSFRKQDEPARNAVEAALALVSGADAIIIDLRNNGGGSPAMVGYLVSAFTLPDANIYNLFHSREGTESERPQDSYPKPLLDVPLYVLISARTGSAAEATAYTLQAARRAVIVGEASGGAANPGGEFPVGEGFSVFVSTGTPVNAVTGTNWEGVGVKPDVPVPADHALERAQVLALEAVVAKKANAAEVIDTQWTLEALRAEQSPRTGPPLGDYAGTYEDTMISASGANLALRRGRRPAWMLVRLHGDAFFVRGEPFRRALFERNVAGKVKGFQLVRSGGQTAWYPKQ